jgi:hypothetical protein
MILRPYQQEVARAIINSIGEKKGLTLSVEIARQGGKNELSAHVELLLLTMHMSCGGNSVKCSPTFKPQTVNYGFAGIWTSEMGYYIRLGAARQIFLSAEESSSVVGHTANILLEIDESQDVSKDKYTKEFRPMASAHNTTTVHYGTTWDDTTLLEEMKQSNIEMEKKDGIKRHFRYDWQEVAKHNPDYLAFVESERERLGENHPMFLTQYALLPLHGGGGFLSPQQIAQIKGRHSRLRSRGGKASIYVAGIDIAGEAETNTDEILTSPGRDATVITIAEVLPGLPDSPDEYIVKVVEHYCWVGKKHTDLYARMSDIFRHVWNCQRIVCDATGIGEPVTSFLQQRLGSRVIPFKFTQKSKSEMGFDLLAAVNSGRLKVYKQDGSAEYSELMTELEKAKSNYRPNQTLNYHVEPSDGHDDFLMSLALCVQAAKDCRPRVARGKN